MARRTEKINHLLRQEISDLLLRQVRDPRLGGLISVTKVDTASDLSRARVFVSTMGSETEKQEVLEALMGASGFLRRELKGRLTLRMIPELSFCQDDTIEQGARVLQLIDQCESDDVIQGEH